MQCLLKFTNVIFTSESIDNLYSTSVFQVTSITIDEPDFNTVSVYLPIIRNAGTLGNVVVQWMATINGELAAGDLLITSGNVSFAAGETMKTLLLEVMADNIPEIEEVRRIEKITITHCNCNFYQQLMVNFYKHILKKEYY